MLLLRPLIYLLVAHPLVLDLMRSVPSAFAVHLYNTSQRILYNTSQRILEDRTDASPQATYSILPLHIPISRLPTMFYLLPFLFLPTIVSPQQICFNRNGLRTNDIPCTPNASVSACCGRTFKCMSNGLCAPGPDTAAAGFQIITAFYQGSCTDNAWSDAACPNFCTGALDSPSGQGLQACAAVGEGKFCCWRSGVDCCRNGTAVFELGAGNAFTTVGVGASVSSVGLSTSIGSSQGAQSTLDASTSATSGLMSAASQWLSGTPTSSQTGASSSGSEIDATAIGAGVGVGVGIPLLLGIIAAALLCRRRKRRQAAYAANTQMAEKPELDSWNSNVSHPTFIHGKHVELTQQHEMDAVDRRVFEMR